METEDSASYYWVFKKSIGRHREEHKGNWNRMPGWTENVVSSLQTQEFWGRVFDVLNLSFKLLPFSTNRKDTSKHEIPAAWCLGVKGVDLYSIVREEKERRSNRDWRKCEWLRHETSHLSSDRIKRIEDTWRFWARDWSVFVRTEWRSRWKRQHAALEKNKRRIRKISLYIVGTS